jgi:hypothetical protein
MNYFLCENNRNGLNAVRNVFSKQKCFHLTMDLHPNSLYLLILLTVLTVTFLNMKYIQVETKAKLLKTVYSYYIPNTKELDEVETKLRSNSDPSSSAENSDLKGSGFKPGGSSSQQLPFTMVEHSMGRSR